MAEQQQHQHQHQHHHHHHHKDGSSRFKERNLNAIVLKRKMEKWLKIVLLVIAILMIIAVILTRFIQ
jgi:Co/Zn/Cd efflux system component